MSSHLADQLAIFYDHLGAHDGQATSFDHQSWLVRAAHPVHYPFSALVFHDIARLQLHDIMRVASFFGGYQFWYCKSQRLADTNGILGHCPRVISVVVGQIMLTAHKCG